MIHLTDLPVTVSTVLVSHMILIQSLGQWGHMQAGWDLGVGATGTPLPTG